MSGLPPSPVRRPAPDAAFWFAGLGRKNRGKQMVSAPEKPKKIWLILMENVVELVTLVDISDVKNCAVTWKYCVERHWVKCEHKVRGITVEFWTVWPLIEKRRVQINTMSHASITQHVLMWLARPRFSQATAQVLSCLDLNRKARATGKYSSPGSKSICNYLILSLIS